MYNIIWWGLLGVAVFILWNTIGVTVWDVLKEKFRQGGKDEDNT